MRLVLLALCASSIALAKPRAPLVHAPLAWTMTPERAAKALTRAKLAPRHDERRAYFDDGGGGVSHTTEPELHWKLANGRAEARFQWSATATEFRLDEIQLFTTHTAAELRRELAALERRYGKPYKHTPAHRLWVRDGVWLVVIASTTADPKTQRFELSVHYRRDDRPPP
jgi:hypothetical protein